MTMKVSSGNSLDTARGLGRALLSVARRPEFWLLCGGVVGFGVLVWYLSDSLTHLISRAGDLRLWILSFGSLAPLVYMVVFALQILLAPLAS